MRAFFAVLAIAVAIGAPDPAQACSLPRYMDDGRYVGGDLATQVARKTDTIQIVRAARRRLLIRSYSEAAYFLRSGEEPPSTLHQPEYTDTFVVEFEVLETLMGAAQARETYYDRAPRVTAYGAAELIAFQRSMGESFEATIGPDLSEQRLDRPWHDGYPFTGGVVPAGQETSCNRPYFIDLGQTFIALRDSMGRFYLTEVLGAELLTGLRIDVEYRRENDRRPVRTHFNMQALILIQGDADPFLVRLRQALAADGTPPR